MMRCAFLQSMVEITACLDDDELDSMDGRRTQMSNKTKDKKGKAVSRNLVA